MLAHGHGGPDPAALRHQGEAGASDLVGAGPGQLPLAEPHAAAGRPDQPHQREQQGALARAVSAEHGQRVAAVDIEVHTVQDLALPVAGAEVTNVK
jgi:hypothetical protein